MSDKEYYVYEVPTAFACGTCGFVVAVQNAFTARTDDEIRVACENHVCPDRGRLVVVPLRKFS